MIELKITLMDEEEIGILEEVALLNGLSMIDYAANIVRGWLKGQLRGRYLKHIQELEPSNLKVLIGKDYKALDIKAKELKKVK